MAQEMVQCERMGINPKWPSLTNVVRRLKAREDGWVDSPLTLVETKINHIWEYVTRKDISPTKQIPNRRNATNSSAEDLALWVSYYQVGIKQEFFWHHRFRIIFPDHPRGGLFFFDLKTCAQMMALLSWRDAVCYQSYLTFAALNRKYQLVLQYEVKHRRAQVFLLRLYADWVGDVSHQWPAYAYDEPISIGVHQTLMI